VSAQDAADLAIALGDGRHTGIWHLSSSRRTALRCRRDENGRHLRVAASSRSREPVTKQQVPDIFRHRYTALQTQKAAKLPGVTI